MLYREPPRGHRIAFARSFTRESKPLASTVPKYAVDPSSRVTRRQVDAPGPPGRDRVGGRFGIQLPQPERRGQVVAGARPG